MCDARRVREAIASGCKGIRGSLLTFKLKPLEFVMIFLAFFIAVTRALAYAISTYDGVVFIRERRNVPKPIRKRRKTVTAGTQMDLRRESVSTGTQADFPHAAPIEQRRKTITVGTQVDTPANLPEIWCICREPEHGAMIFCENSNCLIGWFHMECLRIEEAPKGSWYCPNCSNL